MAVLKWPGEQDRLALLGSSGSGKTTVGAWHLSGKDFNKQPWLILNTKDDPLINEIADIEGVKTIDVDDTPGDRGLYIVNPEPSESDAVDALLRRVWLKQNVGVFVDEGYMLEIKDAFNALLTQGRSRNIAMMVLSQRPAWISKFVFSEANFVQVMRLGHEGDRKNVAQFVPMDYKQRLPNYYSLWYNVTDNQLIPMGPVPQKDIIISRLKAKFPKRQSLEDYDKTGAAAPQNVQVIRRKL